MSSNLTAPTIFARPDIFPTTLSGWRAPTAKQGKPSDYFSDCIDQGNILARAWGWLP
ncbi:MAG TPA: hypothetical protein VNT99_05180 [Methylomirabilota bacterium]|nr:hypothetical protein [Methylomirabilota bacterium]